jgi:biopolymer transport protein ExbD
LNFGAMAGNHLTNEDLAQAAKKLISIKPNVEVLIKGHQNVRYEHVIGPIAVLQDAGVKKVNLIMEFEDPRL